MSKRTIRKSRERLENETELEKRWRLEREGKLTPREKKIPKDPQERYGISIIKHEGEPILVIFDGEHPIVSLNCRKICEEASRVMQEG